MNDIYSLRLRCDDQPGLVAKVAGFLADNGCNIVDAQQFDDILENRFFMRVAFEANAGKIGDAFECGFSPIAEQAGMDWLIAPEYVKPFVKGQKNYTLDAEAICEAAQRPSMHFVAVKTELRQANALLSRARDLFVRQRTPIINALHGHIVEFAGSLRRDFGMHGSCIPLSLTRHPSCCLRRDRYWRRCCSCSACWIIRLTSSIERSRDDEVARRSMTIRNHGR